VNRPSSIIAFAPATAVHELRLGRPVRELVFLDHRQRVHVGAQPDRTGRPFPLAADHADDAGPSDPGVHLDAVRLQALGDQRRGPVLLEPDFRVRVQVAPELGQTLVMRQDRGQRPAQRSAKVGFHQCAAAARSIRRRGSTAK
jgi:hypothetical protein